MAAKVEITEQMIVDRIKHAALHGNKDAVLECARALAGDGGALDNFARWRSIGDAQGRVYVVSDALRAALHSWSVAPIVPRAEAYGWQGGNKTPL